MKETSYVMVKPGFADDKKVIETIKGRLTGVGLKIEKEAYVKYDVEHARAHYAAHVNEEFYPKLEKYITGSKAYGMIVTGESAISTIRALVGATKNPDEGTIRYDIPKMLGLPLRVTENVVHASDGTEAAEKEIAIFNELVKKNINQNM